jgi:hypothetical protein
MGVLALVVGAGILYLIFTQPLTSNVSPGPPTLTIEGFPTARVNQPHTITVRVSGHDGQEVRVTANGETQLLICPGEQCTFPLSYTFSSPGIQIIQAATGYLAAEWSLDVKTNSSVCLDGTLEGVCSTPPFRCVGQSLIPSCVECGCPSGESCVDTKCVAVPLALTLELGELPLFYTTSLAHIPIVLHNTNSFSLNGIFVGRIRWYASPSTLLHEQSQQFLIEELPGESSTSFTITSLPPQGATLLHAEWYPAGGVYDDSTLLAELPSMKPITVSEDTNPPAPPTAFTYVWEGDVLQLSWNASSSQDVKEYLIHRQSLSTGGFTTYSLAGTTSEESFSLTDVNGGTAFVLTAKDGAGNESTPTSPLVVNAP